MARLSEDFVFFGRKIPRTPLSDSIVGRLPYGGSCGNPSDDYRLRLEPALQLKPFHKERAGSIGLTRKNGRYFSGMLEFFGLTAYLTDHLPEIIGFLATVCTISSFLPQAVKIMRERDAESVSLRMYAITVTGFSLWTAYGVLMESLPLIFANAVSLSISFWILILKLRYSRTKSRPATNPPQRE